VMSECPDYTAAAINLWYQDGNEDKFDDARQIMRQFYLDRAFEIVNAAAGDKVLYRRATDNDTLATGAESGLFVQVWPHE